MQYRRSVTGRVVHGLIARIGAACVDVGERIALRVVSRNKPGGVKVAIALHVITFGSDVGGSQHEAHRQLPLDGEIPLVHARRVEIGGEREYRAEGPWQRLCGRRGDRGRKRVHLAAIRVGKAERVINEHGRGERRHALELAKARCCEQVVEHAIAAADAHPAIPGRIEGEGEARAEAVPPVVDVVLGHAGVADREQAGWQIWVGSRLLSGHENGLGAGAGAPVRIRFVARAEREREASARAKRILREKLREVTIADVL